MSNSMEDAFKKAGVKGSRENLSNKKEEREVIKFYSDPAKTKLKPSLVENDARAWANKFVRKEKDDLTSSQLRRFYGEVLSLEEKLKAIGRQNFEVILPHIKMLKSKAAYASGNKKIPKSFKEFIDVMVDGIENDPKDFDAFKLIFEAVVGFSIGKGMRQ